MRRRDVRRAHRGFRAAAARPRRCPPRPPARAPARRRRAQRGARAGIARLLDRHAVAAPKQHRGGQAQRRLRAGDDQHLLGLAAHGARGAQMLGDRGAQRHQPGRIAVRHLLGVSARARAAPPAGPRRRAGTGRAPAGSRERAAAPFVARPRWPSADLRRRGGRRARGVRRAGGRRSRRACGRSRTCPTRRALRGSPRAAAARTR